MEAFHLCRFPSLPSPLQQRERREAWRRLCSVPPAYLRPKPQKHPHHQQQAAKSPPSVEASNLCLPEKRIQDKIQSNRSTQNSSFEERAKTTAPKRCRCNFHLKMSKAVGESANSTSAAAASAAGGADGPAPSVGSSGPLSWFAFAWTPDPSIPYGFLLISYVILALCSLVLLLVQLQGGSSAEAVQGYWLVPAPAAPLSLWAMFMRSRAKQLATPASEKKDQ